MSLTKRLWCLNLVVLQLTDIIYARPAYYQFGYQVDTLDTGDYHGHMEQLDGHVKRGEFKVRLPDGRLQVTSYQADENGFRPKISYEIDPLFVPKGPPVIGFTPQPKFIRRPPPRDYEAPELKYLPPTINYDPRSESRPTLLTPLAAPTPTPYPSVNYLPPDQPDTYLPPQQPQTYLPPQQPQTYQPPQQPQTYQSPQQPVTYLPPQPPKRYSVPDIDYGTHSQYHDTSPLINYRPRNVDNYGNYLSPDMYTPLSNQRQDVPDREEQDGQHYYLVPIHAESGSPGSKPVLALLVKRREK